MTNKSLFLSLGVALLNCAAYAQTATGTSVTQAELLRQQQVSIQRQHALLRQQTELAKMQQEAMDTLKEELFSDGLIHRGESCVLILNNREMLVCGKQQPDSIHRKYLDLIKRKMNKVLEDKEEWRTTIRE